MYLQAGEGQLLVVALKQRLLSTQSGHSTPSYETARRRRKFGAILGAIQ